jgi:hypothetical protein
MPQTQRTAQRKRRSKIVLALGAAGLIAREQRVGRDRRHERGWFSTRQQATL